MEIVEQIRALAAQGIGRLNVEATIGRRMEPDELAAFRKAATVRQLKLSQKRAAGPKTAAERMREHVARTNEIGAIDPRPRHPRLVEACRYDLARFGWTYCRQVLKHRPSKEMREGMIREIQEVLLTGGQIVEEDARGFGKTTWIAYIAPIWATLYGHRRWPVIISATAKQGRQNLIAVKKLLTRSRALAQDFPAVIRPLVALGGVAQRAVSQTSGGQSTDIEWRGDKIVLPTLRDAATGRRASPGCGAIISSVGIGAAIRGANEAGQRPDFLIFDDPQDRKTAHSPSLVAAVIDYIHSDALQLAGHDRVMSAFVTITPQCYGDVASELTSQTKHPNWTVRVRPFVTHVCPRWGDLVAAYVTEYTEDLAAGDAAFTRSRDWYARHRDAFAAVRVVDPLQFDPALEYDAIHHVLNLRARLGEAPFNAEIMMQVADLDSEIAIDADRVAAALNGAPRGVLPPGTDSACAFIDVNITRNNGLSWGVVAFGPGRVAALVAYGRYPERGALIEPGSSDLARNRAVATALRIVISQIAALKLLDAKGRDVTLRALGVDRGYLPAVIHRTLYVLRKTRPLPFPLVAVRGFPWNKFGTRAKDMLRRGDHIFATRSQYGEYLAAMSPYWREIMQASFLETPLMPGSLSLYGQSAAAHFELASEVVAEKLVRKYVVERHGRSETAWDWETRGKNHFCDVLTGCFAIASWYRCYDSLSQVIDGVAAGRVQRREIHQDDLFDPRLNKLVAASFTYSGADDETEGTGETLPPLEAEMERRASPLQPPPAPIYRQPRKQVVHKFKRGRYKR